MSKIEMKVGEWYEQKDGERWQCIAEYPKSVESKYRFICCTSHGDLDTFKENGSFYADEEESLNDFVRHLPGCTGFDWQEPKIPEGWRRLADDEILTTEDKYLQADGLLNCVFSYAGRTVKEVVSNWGVKSIYPYAIVRKIEEPKPEPKFKVGDVVYATKPKNCSQPPVWVYEMNLLQGKALTVKKIEGKTVDVKETIYSFHPDWLSKEPPAARYRPFANDEEYAPHFDRPVKRAYNNNEHVPGAFRILAYGECKVWTSHDYMTYEEMFHDGRKFADTNEPFGVKIS